MKTTYGEFYDETGRLACVGRDCDSEGSPLELYLAFRCFISILSWPKLNNWRQVSRHNEVQNQIVSWSASSKSVASLRCVAPRFGRS